MSVKNKNNVGNIEDALLHTGFGLYSVALMIMIFFFLHIKAASIHALNYVIPYAMCEMEIDELTHGALNSASQFGEAILSPVWAMLSDSYGRKPVFIAISVLCFLFSLGVVFAQTSITLFIFTFLMGLMVGSLVYISGAILCEVHEAKYRSTLVIYTVISMSVSQILFPSIALGVIPLEFQTDIGSIKFTSWRLFLFIQLTLPALICFLCCLFSYESPKYLLTNVNSKAAVQVLEKIYKWNNRKDSGTFPYSDLEPDLDWIDDVLSPSSKSIWKSFILSFKRMTPLFKPPCLMRLIFLLLLLFCNGLSGSIKSWMPQYLATLSDYQLEYGDGNSENVCEVIAIMSSGNSSSNSGASTFCSKNTVDKTRFINSVILSSIVLASLVIQTVVLKFIKKKYLLIGLLAVQTTCLFVATFLPHSMIPLMMSVAFYHCILSLILTLSCDAFPTSIRAFGVTLSSVCFEIGIASSSLFLPTLLVSECNAPFCIFGSFAIVAAIIALFIDKIFSPISL